jgi:hypothetical protein
MHGRGVDGVGDHGIMDSFCVLLANHAVSRVSYPKVAVAFAIGFGGCQACYIEALALSVMYMRQAFQLTVCCHDRLLGTRHGTLLWRFRSRF